MELRQLEYAIAVAEELHFGRAAARLYVAQQSVSEQIRRLEHELGASLFTRTSRVVTLTAVGEAFIPEARRTLEAAGHALDVGQQAARRSRAVLRIGYADELGERLTRLVLPALRKREPHLGVEPQWMSTPNQISALTERRLDLVLGWMAEAGPGLRHLVVAREALVLVLSADHELAAEPVVDPVRLSGQPLVLVSRSGNPALHDSIVSQLEDRGAEVVVAHEIVGIERMFPLVLAGSAIGIALSSSVAAARPFPGVVYRHLPEPAPAVEARLVWRDEHVPEPAVRAAVRVVRKLVDAGALEPPGGPSQ